MSNYIYTVEDVSKMLDIHHRTVRRYIKEGKLNATKVGGVWRISKGDLKNLMSNKDFVDEAEDIWSRKIDDFIRNGSQDEFQNCSVVDFYSDDKEKVNNLCQDIIKKINSNSEYKIKFQYVWNDQTMKARFIFWGDLEFISELFSIIIKYKKGV